MTGPTRLNDFATVLEGWEGGCWGDPKNVLMPPNFRLSSANRCTWWQPFSELFWGEGPAQRLLCALKAGFGSLCIGCFKWSEQTWKFRKKEILAAERWIFTVCFERAEIGQGGGLCSPHEPHSRNPNTYCTIILEHAIRGKRRDLVRTQSNTTLRKEMKNQPEASCLKFSETLSGHERPCIRVKDVRTKTLLSCAPNECWGEKYWRRTSARRSAQTSVGYPAWKLKVFLFGLLFLAWWVPKAHYVVNPWASTPCSMQFFRRDAGKMNSSKLIPSKWLFSGNIAYRKGYHIGAHQLACLRPQKQYRNGFVCKIGGPKLNAYFFLKLFGNAGYPRTSRQKVWFPWVSWDIPFTRKTPTPPEDIQTKKFGFGFLVLAWKSVHIKLETIHSCNRTGAERSSTTDFWECKNWPGPV